VVLFDGLTGVRFSACPRFTPTLSFRRIGLTGDLIYIKSRRLDFFSFLSFSSSARAAVVHRAARGLAARRPAPPPLLRAPHADPRRHLSSLPPHRPAPRTDPHRRPLSCSRRLTFVPPRHPAPPSRRAAATAPQPPPRRFSTIHRRRCRPKLPPLSRAVVRHHRGTLGFASPRLLALPSRARSNQHHGSRQEKGEGTSG
jgi:hypothetical protein